MHKFFFLNSLNYYLLQVKKIHGDSVKNESAKAKKRGGAKRPPPPACLGLKILLQISSIKTENVWKQSNIT